MSEVAVRIAIAETLMELAREDPTVMVVTSDARGSAAISKFFELFPDRAVEVGIAEQSAIGIAAGLASCGKKPYVFGPACFYSARALEQIKNDVAYSDMNVKIVAVSGGVSYGPLGSTHHALHDIAVFRAIPNISVCLPSDAHIGKAIVKKLHQANKPAYIRVGRNPVPIIYGENPNVEIGKGIVIRNGKDLAIVVTGELTWHALKASEILSKEGIETTVVDMPFVEPIDEELIIHLARKVGLILTVEEHSVRGGLGEAICSIVARECFGVVEIVGFPHEYPVTGTQKDVFSHYGLDYVGIARRASEFLGRMRHVRRSPISFH